MKAARPTAPAPTVPQVSADNSSTGSDTSNALLPSSNSGFQFSDVCRLHSKNPYIVVADHRLQSSSFLFLPAENPSLVFLDSVLERMPDIANWLSWKEPRLPPSNPPFIVRESPNKGLGMFAVRPLARGEIIVVERPVLVSHPYLSIHPDQKHTFYESALAGLSPAAQASITSLHNAHPETPAVGRIEGIILTNALIASEAPDTDLPTTALFPQICRANHACAPNASYAFSKDFTGRLCALRPIAAEEEITIAYTEVAVPRAERRQALEVKYKFECGCAACDVPEAALARSDARRAAINEYTARLRARKPGEYFPTGASLAHVKELVRWAEEEGLVETACSLAMSGLWVARQDKDEVAELKFMFKAIEYVRGVQGNDSPGVAALVARLPLGMSVEQIIPALDKGLLALFDSTFVEPF